MTSGMSCLTGFHKVCLTGAPGVGKTSIFVRIRKGCFMPTISTTTVGIDTHEMIRQINGKEKAIMLYDTAGLEYYGTMNHSYYRNASAVIYVFSYSDMYSLESLIEHLEEAKEYAYENCFYALVCNKIDLDENECIPKDIVRAKSAMMECDKIYYVSAKTGEGIEHLVNDLFKYIGDWKNDLHKSVTLVEETVDKKRCC
jgi:small GTP-binding protein